MLIGILADDIVIMSVKCYNVPLISSSTMNRRNKVESKSFHVTHMLRHQNSILFTYINGR